MAESDPQFAAERAELEAVLASGVFSRAPSLAQFLSYIGNRYFAGEGAQIKEYNIAVEALGRGADFDQKKDAIVRVEAHRLRKRLRQYYESEGADHALRIELPPGSYTPVFVRSGDAVANATVHPAADSTPRSLGTTIPLWARLAFIILMVGVGIGLFAWSRQSATGGNQPGARSAAEVPVDLVPLTNVSEVSISAGSSTSVVDTEGRTWVADRYFQGGEAKSASSISVEGTLKPELFHTWREGDFTYKIPLKPGTYELTLFFCEPSDKYSADNMRTFGLLIQGQYVSREFDVYTEAGAAKRLFASTWKDIKPDDKGYLVLEFHPNSGPAILHGIQVVPGVPGKMRPLRIAAREASYTDAAGHLFLSDRYFAGGKLVKRIEGIDGTEDPDLYRGERYGRLTYTLPVPADSTYTAVLHFAETWFGGTGLGRDGARLFDILCNGLILQRNVSIIDEAGGPFKALRKTFRGLKPTPNGKLVIQFVPSKNYAFINALEILDEAGADAKPVSRNTSKR